MCKNALQANLEHFMAKLFQKSKSLYKHVSVKTHKNWNQSTYLPWKSIDWFLHERLILYLNLKKHIIKVVSAKSAMLLRDYAYWRNNKANSEKTTVTLILNK